MKWPVEVVLIRHGKSAYNQLRDKKVIDPVYQAFRREFTSDPRSARTRELAEDVQARFALGVSDYETPLTDDGVYQARATGAAFEGDPVPETVFASPYCRTRATLAAMIEGWPALGEVRVVFEDRIREQEHGLALLYNDWRVFHALHPDQKRLHDLLGPYWYQYPQGESVSQVRDRIRSFLGTLIREHAGERVMLITHHLTILSFRGLLERLTPEQFIHLDENEKPVNCGVTRYVGDPELGHEGRFVLASYNHKYY